GLPAAGLPDEADDLSAVDAQVGARHRADARAAATLVLDDDVLELERGGHAGPNGSTGQARRREPVCTSAGTSMRHESWAYAQRGWNEQPVGKRPGVGGAPAIAANGLSATSGCGRASS